MRGDALKNQSHYAGTLAERELTKHRTEPSTGDNMFAVVLREVLLTGPLGVSSRNAAIDMSDPWLTRPKSANAF